MHFRTSSFFPFILHCKCKYIYRVCQKITVESQPWVTSSNERIDKRFLYFKSFLNILLYTLLNTIKMHFTTNLFFPFIPSYKCKYIFRVCQKITVKCQPRVAYSNESNDKVFLIFKSLITFCLIFYSIL